MDQIHFIITGGTIDSYYDGTKDTAVPNQESVIPGFIKNLKLPVEHQFTTICMKDSRAITDDDRDAMAKTIQESSSTKFVITHGTYTMPDTARYLKQHLGVGVKTVILTGAFVPLTDVVRSDGAFNLGFVMAQLDHLSFGFYVAMNGQIFEADEAIKLVTEGKFDSTNRG